MQKTGPDKQKPNEVIIVVVIVVV